MSFPPIYMTFISNSVGKTVENQFEKNLIGEELTD